MKSLHLMKGLYDDPHPSAKADTFPQRGKAFVLSQMLNLVQAHYVLSQMLNLIQAHYVLCQMLY